MSEEDLKYIPIEDVMSIVEAIFSSIAGMMKDEKFKDEEVDAMLEDYELIIDGLNSYVDYVKEGLIIANENAGLKDSTPSVMYYVSNDDPALLTYYDDGELVVGEKMYR